MYLCQNADTADADIMLTLGSGGVEKISNIMKPIEFFLNLDIKAGLNAHWGNHPYSSIKSANGGGGGPKL